MKLCSKFHISTYPISTSKEQGFYETWRASWNQLELKRFQRIYLSNQHTKSETHQVDTRQVSQFREKRVGDESDTEASY